MFASRVPRSPLGHPGPSGKSVQSKRVAWRYFGLGTDGVGSWEPGPAQGRSSCRNVFGILPLLFVAFPVVPRLFPRRITVPTKPVLGKGGTEQDQKTNSGQKRAWVFFFRSCYHDLACLIIAWRLGWVCLLHVSPRRGGARRLHDVSLPRG